jgi:hypothetical protein
MTMSLFDSNSQNMIAGLLHNINLEITEAGGTINIIL